MRGGVRRGLSPLAVLLALGIAAPAAWAQPESPPAGPETAPALGDVPAGEGTVAGRVVHSVSGEPLAGVDVILYALSSQGQPGVRRTTSGAAGGFAFEKVAASPGMTYLLGARHDQVPFVGERVTFQPGETRKQVELRVTDRTRDPAAVTVEEARLRLGRSAEGITAVEVHRLRNDAQQVFYVASGERGAGAAPALHILLPEGATDFGLPYAVEPEGVVREGRHVRFFGPVYPGPQELAFSYILPAGEGASRVRKRWPSGADRVRVLHPPGVLHLGAEGLTEVEPEGGADVRGSTDRVFDAGPMPRDGELVLAVEIPPARRDPGALALLGHRSFLELDAEALLVTEEYHLEVRGDSPVLAPEGEPLLRIPVPEGARDLRFGASAPSAGIRFEEGALALHGPLPPGPGRVDLRYRLPTREGRTRLEHRFDRRVPVVDVYVADTGLVVESQRLHRRRPVKAPDERVYMHFEAFHVTPEETVGIALRPLPPRTGLPAGGRAAFVIAAAVLVALLLSGPLRGRGAGAAPEDADELGAPGARTAREEREAIYTSLRDLEHDFETGKVAPEDYGPMREELRRRAAALLRAERVARAETAAQGESAAAPSAAGRCPDCGAETGPEARFCSRCGRPLEARAGARG